MPSAKSTDTLSRRMGRWVAGALRFLVRCEHRIREMLMQRGLPQPLTVGLLWLARALAVCLLVYAAYMAFWVVLLLAALIVYAMYSAQYGYEEEELYRFKTLDDLRKEPGYDPVLYNDYEHQDYPPEKTER